MISIENMKYLLKSLCKPHRNTQTCSFQMQSRSQSQHGLRNEALSLSHFSGWPPPPLCLSHATADGDSPTRHSRWSAVPAECTALAPASLVFCVKLSQTGPSAYLGFTINFPDVDDFWFRITTWRRIQVLFYNLWIQNKSMNKTRNTNVCILPMRGLRSFIKNICMNMFFNTYDNTLNISVFGSSRVSLHFRDM